MKKHRLPELRVVGLFLVIAVHLTLVGAAPAQEQSGQKTRWWRGNLHTHSLWSDGNDFPEMIARWYRKNGYQFLALSDHNVLSRGIRWMPEREIERRGGEDALEKYLTEFGSDWVEIRTSPTDESRDVRLKPLQEFRPLIESPGEFLLIEGEEISDSVDRKPVHLNATNLSELLPPVGGQSVSEAINNNLRAAEEQAQRTGQDILVHLNHPNFGWAVTAEDLAAATAEKYFEVYNGHPSVGHTGDPVHPPVEELWDIANTIRIGELNAPPLFGLAVDDSHKYHGRAGSRPGRGWIMVRAESLEAGSLIRAIRRGDFYASSGVSLSSVDFDEATQTYRFKIEGKPGVQYTTEFVGTLKDYDRSSRVRMAGDGEASGATKIYSPDVGKVFSRQTSLTPEYQLAGNELYVRAVVTSSVDHHDPSFDGQKQQAWVQPVGWNKKLPTAPVGSDN